MLKSLLDLILVQLSIPVCIKVLIAVLHVGEELMQPQELVEIYCS